MVGSIEWSLGCTCNNGDDALISSRNARCQQLEFCVDRYILFFVENEKKPSSPYDHLLPGYHHT